VADVNLAGGVAVLVRQPGVRVDLTAPRRVTVSIPPPRSVTVTQPQAARFTSAIPTTDVAVLPIGSTIDPDWLPTTGAEPGGFYRHGQTFASTVWLITHNLGFEPGGIEVLDHTGAPHRPVVSWPDTNTVRLDFDYPVYGTARLS
jgi:hypothetical protein